MKLNIDTFLVSYLADETAFVPSVFFHPAWGSLLSPRGDVLPLLSMQSKLGMLHIILPSSLSLSLRLTFFRSTCQGSEVKGLLYRVIVFQCLEGHRDSSRLRVRPV